MEVRKVDAEMIKDEIAKKKEAEAKEAEETRVENVKKTIEILEKTALKMLETLTTSCVIVGIHRSKRDLLQEPEVQEWAESRGFKINIIAVDFYTLEISEK